MPNNIFSYNKIPNAYGKWKMVSKAYGKSFFTKYVCLLPKPIFIKMIQVLVGRVVGITHFVLQSRNCVNKLISRSVTIL